MRETKKLTLSAATVALGTVFMVLGAVFEILDLSAAVLASLLVVFIYVELGSPYTWLVWISTSLTTFICYSGSLIWLVYLTLFGIYPILKGYIERLPRIFWLVLKLVFVNLMLTFLAFFAKPLTGISFFGDLSTVEILPREWLLAVLWVVMNLAFLLYDRLIVLMLAFYNLRIRPRIKNLLK